MGKIFGRREQRQLYPYPPIPAYPSASGYGGSFQSANLTERSLTVPTVWSCVALLANTVSMLDVEVHESEPADLDTVAKKVKLPPVFVKPEPYRTMSEWLHTVMVSVLLRGNAYGIKVFDKRGNLESVLLVHPDLVRVSVNDSGLKVFTVSTKVGTVEYDSDEMWHLTGMTLPGSFEGLSPIAYAASCIGLDIKSRRFADEYFDGNAMPKAVITHEKKFDQQQAQVIKDRVLAAMQGRDPLVLGGSLQFTPIAVKPEESQFLETQNAGVGQIARYFGVPAEMVGGSSGGNSMTYKNVEQRNLDFLTYSVQFWLKRLDDSLSGLLADSRVVKISVNALLRTDIQTQATVDNMRIAGKILTPDEVRARLNLPPMTDEQKELVDLVPIVVSPLGGMKGIPPDQAQQQKQDEEGDEG